MTGRWRAFLRLLAVQGAWSYERMLGIGIGYAAEPMLEDLKSADPTRHAEAVIRSAEFFNCHPYLAGLALGASVRSEYNGAPGAQISRLRTALCSPLGSLGDQFFWAGLVPTVMALALLATPFKHAGLALLGLLGLYNLGRLLTGVWALNTGLRSGMQVGAAITESWLPKWASRIGPIAGFSVGLSLPVVGGWLLGGLPRVEIAAALAVGAAGLLAGWRFGAQLTSIRFGLLVLGATLALTWATA